MSRLPSDVPVGKWIPSEGRKGTLIVDSGGASGKYVGIPWEDLPEKIQERIREAGGGPEKAATWGQ